MFENSSDVARITDSNVQFRACPFCASRPDVQMGSDFVSVKCSGCGATIPSEIYKGAQGLDHFSLSFLDQVELARALAFRWNGLDRRGDGRHFSVLIFDHISAFRG